MGQPRLSRIEPNGNRPLKDRADTSVDLNTDLTEDDEEPPFVDFHITIDGDAINNIDIQLPKP